MNAASRERFVVFSVDNLQIFLAAMDSHIIMLMDAPKDGRPGLLVEEKIIIRKVLISIEYVRDFKFIFVIDFIFPLFIASIA